jgi:ABC-2 type transport system ATP-binding protein
MGELLAVTNLHKRYGERAAVDGLSLAVGEGEIYGLLGPNGAGKTTTVRIVTGLLEPSSGTVRVAGFDPFAEPLAARANLGWAGQELALYEDLSAAENLRLAATLGRVPRREVRPRAAELLELVGLAARGRDRVSSFSGGMKRRLHLAMALVHRPRVLLLDEPLVGIDPQARALLLDTIRGLAGGGCAVLLTTHDMDDAERLCHRVGIMDHGRLLAEGTVAELQASLGERDVLRLEGAFDPAAPPAMPAGVEPLACRETDLVLAATHGEEALPAVLAAAEAAGAQVRRASLERPTLETLFLKLTGRELRD